MSKEDALRKLGRWFEKISPPVPVGGLQITDFAVRYAGQKGGRFIVESMRLQPGVIEDGKVKSKEILVAVLAELRKRVAPNPTTHIMDGRGCLKDSRLAPMQICLGRLFRDLSSMSL